MGFVAMNCKEVEILIKQGKSLTKFEATAVLTFDFNFNRNRSISEYRRIFGWKSRWKVRQFINCHPIPLIGNGSRMHTARTEKQNCHPKPANNNGLQDGADSQHEKLPPQIPEFIGDSEG